MNYFNKHTFLSYKFLHQQNTKKTLYNAKETRGQAGIPRLNKSLISIAHRYSGLVWQGRSSRQLPLCILSTIPSHTMHSQFVVSSLQNPGAQEHFQIVILGTGTSYHHTPASQGYIPSLPWLLHCCFPQLLHSLSPHTHQLLSAAELCNPKSLCKWPRLWSRGALARPALGIALQP